MQYLFTHTCTAGAVKGTYVVVGLECLMLSSRNVMLDLSDALKRAELY